MASFGSNFGVLSQVDALAQELGVNNWQLQPAKYNGVVFHVVRPLLDRLNNDLNPFAGVLDNAISAFGIDPAANLGDNTNLPFGTSTVSTNIVDSGRAKMVVHEIPNGEDVFENLGWYGENITFLGIMWGSAYATALQNIQNAFFNPAAVPASTDKYVLVHPILGTIKNTRLMSYRRIHVSNKWRAVLYEFTFRTPKPVSQIQAKPVDTLSQIQTAIGAILSISTTLLSAWGDIYAISLLFGNSGNQQTVIPQLQTDQQAIQTTVNENIVVTKLMVDNLKPAGFNSIQLDNTPTQPTSNQYFQYFKTNMTPSDVNSLIETNNVTIQNCINTLNELNTTVFYDTITNLIELQSQVDLLAKALLTSFYGASTQYTVPYDTDIRNVCFNNNLDYATQSDTVWQLNKDKLSSSNFIPKGLVLTLPQPNQRNTR